jgi:signal transduction histidine kinase
LSNAIKFTKDGEISISTQIQEGKILRGHSFTRSLDLGESRTILVAVKDTGIGIDPEIFPNLFKKFTSKSGTGLGLFISKNIIDAHNGKIWAENNPDGIGATFVFSLSLNEYT